jgi:PAS domain S-box-containing protein
VFAGIALAMLAGGAWSYVKWTEVIRQEQFRALAAIGKLKSGQIQQWRNERLADARRLARGPLVTRAIAEFLRDPDREDRRTDLRQRLQPERMVDVYDGVLLLAPDGHILFTTENPPKPVDPATLRACAAALVGREAVLSDFFRAAPDGIVRIDAVAAVRDDEGRPVAVVVLRSAADAYLYPLLKSWPTPSPSAETLIVQRDGEDVVFLNELRHRPRTALSLRMPVSGTNNPAVQAALGRQGSFEGRDYRDVYVLADLRPIPESPWFMVAKADADEVLADARSAASLVALLAASFVLLAGASTAYLYVQRQAGIFRDLYESERRQRESEEASRAILNSIGDAVITTELGGRVRGMNPAAERLTGWTEAEGRGQPLEAVFHIVDEATRATMKSPVDAVLRDSGTTRLTADALLITREGIERRIIDSAAPIRDDRGAVSGVVLVFSDQTVQHAARQALRESEDRYRDLVENSHALICTHDLEGKLLSVNEVASRITGYSLEALLQMNMSELLDPQARPLFSAYLAEIQATGHTRGVLRIQTASGEIRLWEYQTTLRTEGVPVPVVRGMAHDITEQRRAEESVRVQAHMLDNVGQAVIATDISGIITYANRFAEELYGWSPAEMLGRNILDVLVPQTSLGQAEEIMARLRQGENWSGEFLVQRRDGVVFPAMVNDSPLLNKSGKLVGIIGISSDITERKRADAEQRLQSAALNAAVFPIVITDRDGTIEWVNPAFTTLTLYSAEEAIGQNPRALLRSGVHDRAFYEDLWNTILAGNVWRGEITNRRKDGSRYFEDMAITPVKDAGGEITHFIAIKRDLTKDKELQGQFLQAQKMEIVGRLAGGIAHDFNNLLTVINGTADLAAENLIAGDPLLADLGEIRRAGDRAAALTQQLLAFSRKQIMKPDVVNLGALAANLRNMLQRLIGEHIDLMVTPAKDVGNVLVDPGQMEQVIMNLVVNARDAMPTGGTLTVETRDVELDAAFAAVHPSVQPGPHVTVVVSDTGAGMDEATRLRVFEPFFTTKEPGKGTGLGLATVYGIVKQSSGSIWVSSTAGKGTTFTIYLPRVDAVAHASQKPRTLATLSGTETILLVEDENVVRHLATRILRGAGYTVLTASHGVEALQLLERHDGPVDLLLTDVVLPGMSGRDLATRVAEVRPESKVLYTSGYTDDAILRHGVLDNATHFVGKPYSRAELTRKVREVLDSPGDRPTA